MPGGLVRGSCTFRRGQRAALIQSGRSNRRGRCNSTGHHFFAPATPRFEAERCLALGAPPPRPELSGLPSYERPDEQDKEHPEHQDLLDPTPARFRREDPEHQGLHDPTPARFRRLGGMASGQLSQLLLHRVVELTLRQDDAAPRKEDEKGGRHLLNTQGACPQVAHGPVDIPCREPSIVNAQPEPAAVVVHPSAPLNHDHETEEHSPVYEQREPVREQHLTEWPLGDREEEEEDGHEGYGA